MSASSNGAHTTALLCAGDSDDLRIPLRFDGPHFRVARCVHNAIRVQAGNSDSHHAAMRRAAVLLTENILTRLQVSHMSWTRTLMVVVFIAAVCLPLVTLALLVDENVLRSDHLTDKNVFWLNLLTRVAVVLTPIAFVGLCVSAAVWESNLRQLNQVVQRHLEARKNEYADLGFSLSVQHRAAVPSNPCCAVTSSLRGPLLVLSRSTDKAAPIDDDVKPQTVERRARPKEGPESAVTGPF